MPQMVRLYFFQVMCHSWEKQNDGFKKIIDLVWSGLKANQEAHVYMIVSSSTHTCMCKHTHTHPTYDETRCKEKGFMREYQVPQKKRRMWHRPLTRTGHQLTWVLHGTKRTLHAPCLPVKTAALCVCRLLAHQRTAAHVLLAQMLPAQILVDVGFFYLLWRRRHGFMTAAGLFLFHPHCGGGQQVSKFPFLLRWTISKE